MRRSLVALGLLSAISVAGCEDGPTQTFKAAPNGAGDKWNDGNSPPVSDPGKQGFGVQGGGNNKQEICTAPQTHARWAVMVKQPIQPPRFGAGLDLAGGDDWHGLTIEEAEAVNCQSTNDGDEFGDGSQVNQWGDNGEVWVDYLVSNRKVQFMSFWPGYLGTADATSRDGKHKYSIPVLTQITKDGQPFTIDWKQNPTKYHAEVNELYDAFLATYLPGLPADPDCFGSGACIPGDFGDQAFFGMGPLGLYFWVDNQNAPQPTPSVMTRIDMFLAKVLPFSQAAPLLKLDAEGPIGIAGKLGNATNACSVKLGLTYGDFLKDCVQVTGDTTKDTTELNKLLGGLSHNPERFQFDVQGVDVNVSDNGLPVDDVIHDKDVPTPDDYTSEFVSDQSTLGKMANDYTNNDPTKDKDLHGAGLVYLEYARLVQDALNQYIDPANQHSLGDPACLTDPVAQTGIDPNDPVWPAGCTGFEGFTTAAPVNTGDTMLDNVALGFDVTLANSGMSLGLKPGHPQATFCLDANGDINTGYYDCSAPAGANGDLFTTSYQRVLQVLGGGKVSNLPIEAQDQRFFWRHYVTALVKYFKVAGSAQETVAGVHAQTVDPDNLFFDSDGAGQFEIGEYVDRRFANKTTPPMDLLVVADVKNGIFNDYDFSRELYRGEEAIYSAVLENQSDGLGQEDTALLSNVFGSPLLYNLYVDSTAGKSAYYCATTVDPSNCDGQLPPFDDVTGVPDPDRLKRYPGSFGSAYTAFTLGDTAITVTKTYDNIASAMVNIPLTKDPYDASSDALPAIQKLVPWTPKQPGIGFPIALTGTIDKFIQTSQLDFSGTTISANVDYDVAIDPNTGEEATDGSLQIKAVETTDFLGEVFLCEDGGSLLGVRMYTPVATILDWLQNHPAAYSNCGIVIRYSPYDNYADYITSLTNGVRLGITQGGGFGRVVDVTLFVPGQ